MSALNPAQRRAVGHGQGPLLVIAGPGSGKTRVITQRIVHLLENVPGLQPENILALTFTDKAAHEMASRVKKILPDLVDAPFISTFHSFCHYVLQQHHFERSLLDKVDTWIFLRRRLEQLELENYQKLASPGAFLHDLNDFFSRCQDELVGAEDFSAYVRKVEADFHAGGKVDAVDQQRRQDELRKLQELARVFVNSRRLIESAGYSSLGSLISETVRLWDSEPQCAEKYRSRFHYVLVDEFQDSNYAQVKFLARLVAPPYNIVAVGDDDQAIYRFRGAAHGALTMFKTAFPGAEVVFLNRNYRSTRKILRVADTVISHNHREVNKPKLTAEKREGSSVFLLSSSDYSTESAGIADLVENLLRKGRAASDIAVLYRAHSYRDLLVSEFHRRKIHFVIRGLSVLSTIIVRDLLAYLRLVHSLHDNISLTRVLLQRRWQFPENLALEVRARSASSSCSIYDALEEMDRSLLRPEIEKTRWPELKSILSDLRDRAEHVPITSLLDRMTTQLQMVFLPGTADADCLETFREFLANWEKKSETRRLREFIEYFDYFLEAGGKIEAPRPAGSSNAVQMMSVHAAKGLEFPVVFILSVATRRFPSTERKPVIEFPEALRKGPPPPDHIQLEEERRLFYVAMTRAQELLYISSVITGKKPSVFIDNLLSDPVVRARDAVEIELGGASKEAEPASEPLRPAKSNGDVQPGLFDIPAATPTSTHPPLAAWALATPAVRPEGKLRLSATAIETYLECPLKFKFRHIYRIPTGPQAALTFGNVMHQSVRHYFKLRAKGDTLFENVRQFYFEAWKSAGFEDHYQEETYKKSGISQLRGFVERHESLPIAPENVRTEVHFAHEIEDVLLEGRIDQVNLLKPFGPGTVELVDYKTGRPRTQKDADKSLQLSVYALAAREQLGLDPRALVFYNLTNNVPVSTVRTDKQLVQLCQKIVEVADQIRRTIFPPAPGFACKYCEYVPICPAHEEEF